MSAAQWSVNIHLLEEAYNKVVMKRMQVPEYHKCFHGGSARIIDDVYCGRLSTSTDVGNIEHVLSVA
jgi:hypothetical protein